MDWREHITVDFAVCHGRACFAGTRIPVSVVIDNLAACQTTEEILTSYPSLTAESVRAAIAFAAELAQEQQLPLSA